MTQIQFPNNTIIDFEDASEEEVMGRVSFLQENNPELFEEVPEEIDYGTVSLEELRESGRPSAPGKEKEPKPTHGGEVQDLSFQYFLGRGSESPADTEARLLQTFGEGTFVRDSKGAYILDLDKISPEVKKELDLPDTGTIYANKPGFSGYDVVSFLGAETAPILATVGAGIAATGMGTIPGIALMAAAGAAGRAVDEVIVEDLYEGLQRQTPEDILKASMFEALLVGGSEAVFRTLGATGRFLLKGKGPTPSTERIVELEKGFLEEGLSAGAARRAATRAAREELSVAQRQMIEGDASIPASTLSGKAILGRTQAIWESIFPNDALLAQNAAYATKIGNQVKEGLLTEAEGKELISDGLQVAVNRVRERLLDPKTAYSDANKRLTEVMEREFEVLQDVIEQNAIPGTGLATEFKQQLDDVARLFNMDSTALYKLAEQEMGGLSVSLKTLDDSIAKITARNVPEGAALDPAQRIEAARVGEDLSGGIFKVISDMVQEGQELPISSVPAMRAALRATSDDPMIVGSRLDNVVKQLLDNLDGAVTTKTNELASLEAYWRYAPDPKITQQRNALELLKQANNHYRDGMEIINSGAMNSLIAGIKQKNIVDMSGVVQFIVKNNKPEELKYYLDALTPTPNIVNSVVKAAKENPGLFSRAAELVENGNIKQANDLLREQGLLGTSEKPLVKIFDLPDFYEKLAPDDLTRVRLQGKYAETLRSYDRMAAKQIEAYDTAAGEFTPTQFKENFRQLLAREWLSLNTVKETSRQVPTDLVDLARKFDALGPGVATQLFGKNYPQVRALMDDFRLIGKDETELAEAVLTSFNPPVSQTIDYRRNLDEIITDFKAQTDIINEQSKDAFLTAMQNPSNANPDKLITHLLKNPSAYNTLKKELGEDVLVSLDQEIIEEGVSRIVTTDVDLLDAIKDRVVAHLIPEKMTTDLAGAVQNGTLGTEILTNLAKMNKNGSITNIMGKDFVDDLQKLGATSQVISDSALKGKTGLAAAGYAAGFLTSVILSPVAALTGAASIYGLARVLRSKPVMRYLTSPRLRAYEAERAVRVGAGLPPKQIAAEKARENAFRAVRTIAAQFSTYGVGQAEEAAADRLAPVIEQVRPVVEEAAQQIAPAVGQSLQQIQQIAPVSPGQPPVPAAPAPGQMTAADVERQRVQNQLAGLPA